MAQKRKEGKTVKREILKEKRKSPVKLILILLIAAILIVSGVMVYYKLYKNEEFKELKFDLVAKGYYSGHTQSAQYVIGNKADFSNLWNLAYSIIKPSPVAPEIDFSNNSVIAVFQGNLNCAGPDITIEKIEEYSKQIIVYVKETNVCSQSGENSQPFDIVMTKKIDAGEKILFELMS